MEQALDRINARLTSLELEIREVRRENRDLRANRDEYADPASSDSVGTASGDQSPIRTPRRLLPSTPRPPRLAPNPFTHSPSQTVLPPKELKLTQPEKYSGDPHSCRYFLTQCSMHYLGKPHQFTSDRAKVLFLSSNLSGEALKWVAPLIDRGDPLLDNFSRFTGAFRRMFDRRVSSHTRGLEFFSVRQGSRDLTMYINRFQQLSAEVECTDATKFSVFLLGLKDEIREAIYSVYPMPTKFSALVELALQVEVRLRERGFQQRMTGKRAPIFTPGGGSSNSQVPFKIEPLGGASKVVSVGKGGPVGGKAQNPPRVFPPGTSPRPPLSEEEKARRRRENLCLYCGKPGHSVQECRLVRNQNPQVVSVVSLEQDSPTGSPESSVPAEEQGKGQAQAE